MSRYERRERLARDRLDAAVCRMPARRRDIFLAVCREEASYAEIGARLGLDPAGVEQEFAAALAGLAAALDPPAPWLRRLATWLARRAGG